MQNLVVTPFSFSENISLPSSKSQTMRAILFASLAQGISEIENPLLSSDTKAMITACEKMGAKIYHKDHKLSIQGIGGNIRSLPNVIDAKNSGLILRFMAAVAMQLPFYTCITGDHSIRYNRYVKPLLSGINALGGEAFSTKADDKAPILIKGPLTKQIVTIEGTDSQNVSSLIIAASLRDNITTKIHVLSPQEKPYLDMTMAWLDFLHVPYKRYGYEFFVITGKKTFSAFSYKVPLDMLSASYIIAAALITKKEITLQGFDWQEGAYDISWLYLLQKMKANIVIQKDKLIVGPTSYLQGGVFDINDSIDAVPLFAVLGCYAKDKLILTNCAIARKKESDRLLAISQELTKMGAKIEAKEDCLVIYPSILKGATVYSHHDHRIAMSLAIAALAAENATIIEDVECIEKSFPYFLDGFFKEI